MQSSKVKGAKLLGESCDDPVNAGPRGVNVSFVGHVTSEDTREL